MEIHDVMFLLETCWMLCHTKKVFTDLEGQVPEVIRRVRYVGKAEITTAPVLWNGSNKATCAAVITL